MQMKKWLYSLLLVLTLNSCATLDDVMNLGQYRFPYLRQLVGHHISDVTDRLNGITVQNAPALMIGANKQYYLFRTREYSHTVNTYNGYGTLINQQHKYNSGHIMLVTDSKGYITRYIESGYIPVEGSDFDRTMRSALRDILVFDK